jgi:ribosomal protein S18 acetylase RimI-like enzyme
LKNFDFFSVRSPADGELDWVHARLNETWHGTKMSLHSEMIDMTALPVLVAGRARGFLIYRVRGLAAEIVAMEACETRRGVGTALLVALEGVLERIGVREVWVTTTNDNLDALRFYQRRGFRLEAVRRDAVRDARLLKPAIPHRGAYGIPICDEVDLRAALPLPGIAARDGRLPG